MKRTLFILSMGLLLAGCKSGPLGPYSSPQVIGRVVASDNGRPLKGVSVTRGRPAQRSANGQPLKGGELLMLKPPVRTDENGGFSLASERVLSVFRGSGWNQIRLTFECPGFERFQTNCAANAATNGAGMNPRLDLGTIVLQPLPTTTGEGSVDPRR